MLHFLRQGLTAVGVATASPIAFAIVGIYGILWIIFDLRSFDWHGVATIATWLMTLFIQRAEHRDTQAIQAKLDELLRAHGDARKGMTTLDAEEPEDIERHRERAQKQD